MGYSCTAKASLTEEGVRRAINAKSSNAMPDGGFYEIGRERADGSITGIVWRPLNASERARWAHLGDANERVAKRGSFKIDANGKIVRWPGLPKSVKSAAEKFSAATYGEQFEARLAQL